jgi:hypothetical protein
MSLVTHKSRLAWQGCDDDGEVKTRRCSDEGSVRDEERTVLWCPKKEMQVWLRACYWPDAPSWLIGNSPIWREHFIHTSEIGNLLGFREPARLRISNHAGRLRNL